MIENNNNILINQVFENDISRKAFGSILGSLGHITPAFVSRGEFDSMEGKFLRSNGKYNFGEHYDLYLPEDLNNTDLFFVIFLLNEKFNLELDIKKIIGYVKLSTKDFEKQDILELKNLVNEKIRLIIEGNKLDEGLYSKYEEIIDSQNPHILKKAIRELKNSNNLNGILEEESIKDLLSNKDLLNSLYLQEFDLTFFKKGIKLLREGLMTFTESDLKKAEEEQAKLKKGEVIATHKIDTLNIDKEERKLREKMRINEYKSSLKIARESGDKYNIEKLEIEAANSISSTLYYNFPYKLKDDNFGYQISKILEHKELSCVGFSLVGHAFLNELGIKHNGLHIPKHSALEIVIGECSYLFDATGLTNIEKIEWGDYTMFNNQKGLYRKIKIFGYEGVAVSGSVEKLLLSQVYNNKVCILDKEEKYAEALILSEKNLITDFNSYFNKGNALYGMKKYEESLIFYYEYLKYNPKNSSVYNNIGNIFFVLNDYYKAIEYYDKALEIIPNDSILYSKKGSSLYELNKYDESLIAYDMALEKDPYNATLYGDKGLSLYELGKDIEALLYGCTYRLLNNGEDYFGEYNLLNEREYILKFLKNGDYFGIVDYLKSVETS